jgi:hypothetical protein
VRAARERLAPWPGARVERCAVPQEWPEAAAPFDLIIVSELAYYLAPDELQQLAVRIEGSLDGDGRRVFACLRLAAWVCRAACFGGGCARLPRVALRRRARGASCKRTC